MRASSPELWEQISAGAAAESALWRDTLLAPDEHAFEPVFSPLAEERFQLGLETIYEGYLAHYGRPRLFAARDHDTALLLGDYLYAHGVQRIAALAEVRAVLELGELISACAQLRGDDRSGEGAAWAATAALLGRGELDEAYASLRNDGDASALLDLAHNAAGAEPVERALAAHARHLR